jgi:5-methylcytosine-specific restriction endonuclease McrA
MKLVFFTVATILAATLSAPLDANAATKRSHAARAEFQRLHPCPANGLRRGACPGWQVDHKIPLKCGGVDKTSNMQWLTVRAHKAKTKREARACLNSRRPAGSRKWWRFFW